MDKAISLKDSGTRKKGASCTHNSVSIPTTRVLTDLLVSVLLDIMLANVKIHSGMANLIRSGKPGSEWTANDLLSYNITIETVNNEEEFFEFEGDRPLPPADMNGFLTYLDTTTADNAGDYDTANLLHTLQMAQTSAESWVDEFASRILRKMGYEGRKRLVKVKQMLHFLSGGALQNAQADVCVMSRDEVILLVQEDKRSSDGLVLGSRPQLVAEAIAAFAWNQNQVTLRRQAPLTTLALPGILMIGALPVFYKIIITDELYSAVKATSYPTKQTMIYRFIPEYNGLINHAMSDLDVRRRVVQYYELFRKYLDTAEGIHPS
ncbi:hypothetical protein H0H81_006298 [Sphagnurus paluster]|uniref:Uncharacterized protein n=1 Tax=Sphagnurus paluster TaxID=117069 RepID=A0A9P7FTE9_9AGAR|nr:hypothetical protein H0H81_006298 [Sphagnurus paluster]